jgi:hypothetical protein
VGILKFNLFYGTRVSDVVVAKAQFVKLYSNVFIGARSTLHYCAMPCG